MKIKNKKCIPVREAKLDCDGDGVLISDKAWAVPGEEQRMSNEAARNGDGDLLEFLKG